MCCCATGDAQSLAPDYVAVNLSPCKIYPDMHTAPIATHTSTSSLGGVSTVEGNSSSAPLLPLLPGDGSATEATLNSSLNAEHAPASASIEQSQIVNTFDHLFGNLTPPYTVLSNPSLGAAPGIRALNGILYGANGKPIVLQVGTHPRLATTTVLSTR